MPAGDAPPPALAKLVRLLGPVVKLFIAKRRAGWRLAALEHALERGAASVPETVKGAVAESLLLWGLDEDAVVRVIDTLRRRVVTSGTALLFAGEPITTAYYVQGTQSCFSTAASVKKGKAWMGRPTAAAATPPPSHLTSPGPTAYIVPRDTQHAVGRGFNPLFPDAQPELVLDVQRALEKGWLGLNLWPRTNPRYDGALSTAGAMADTLTTSQNVLSSTKVICTRDCVVYAMDIQDFAAAVRFAALSAMQRRLPCPAALPALLKPLSVAYVEQHFPAYFTRSLWGGDYATRGVSSRLAAHAPARGGQRPSDGSASGNGGGLLPPIAGVGSGVAASACGGDARVGRLSSADVGVDADADPASADDTGILKALLNAAVHRTYHRGDVISQQHSKVVLAVVTEGLVKEVIARPSAGAAAAGDVNAVAVGDDPTSPPRGPAGGGALLLSGAMKSEHTGAGTGVLVGSRNAKKGLLFGEAGHQQRALVDVDADDDSGSTWGGWGGAADGEMENHDDHLMMNMNVAGGGGGGSGSGAPPRRVPPSAQGKPLVNPGTFTKAGPGTTPSPHRAGAHAPMLQYPPPDDESAGGTRGWGAGNTSTPRPRGVPRGKGAATQPQQQPQQPVDVHVIHTAAPAPFLVGCEIAVFHDAMTTVTVVSETATAWELDVPAFLQAVRERPVLRAQLRTACCDALSEKLLPVLSLNDILNVVYPEGARAAAAAAKVEQQRAHGTTLQQQLARDRQRGVHHQYSQYHQQARGSHSHTPSQSQSQFSRDDDSDRTPWSRDAPGDDGFGVHPHALAPALPPIASRGGSGRGGVPNGNARAHQPPTHNARSSGAAPPSHLITAFATLVGRVRGECHLPGTVLFQESDICNTIHIIARGTVRYTPPAGGAGEPVIYGAGCVFGVDGEMKLGSAWSGSLVCVGPLTEVYRILKTDWDEAASGLPRRLMLEVQRHARATRERYTASAAPPRGGGGGAPHDPAVMYGPGGPRGFGGGLTMLPASRAPTPTTGAVAARLSVQRYQKRRYFDHNAQGPGSGHIPGTRPESTTAGGGAGGGIPSAPVGTSPNHARNQILLRMQAQSGMKGATKDASLVFGMKLRKGAQALAEHPPTFAPPVGAQHPAAVKAAHPQYRFAPHPPALPTQFTYPDFVAMFPHPQMRGAAPKPLATPSRTISVPQPTTTAVRVGDAQPPRPPPSQAVHSGRSLPYFASSRTHHRAEVEHSKAVSAGQGAGG